MIDPAFDGIIGHRVILEILTKTAARPAHAYLFCGPDGVGKRLVADRFARLLLGQTQDRPLNAHPDFVALDREEGAKEIKIKQARELLQKMSLTSACGGHRVAMICEADRLNDESANTLLKAIEEPAASTVYLLIAEEPDRLPATLRSRLVAVTFNRVPTKEIAMWIKNETVAIAARGCPGIAKRILDDQAAWNAETNRADALVKTLSHDPLHVQISAIEQLSQSVDATGDADAAWRHNLQLMMRACSSAFASSPESAARVGHGLLHAWQMAGTSLSPRLAIELAAVLPYAKDDLSIPSFLEHSFLC